MADTNTVAVESKPAKTSKASKTPTNGKPSKATVAKIVKTVAREAKKAKVKLTAEDREKMKTMSKEEQTWYTDHGTLRGLRREGKFTAPQLSTGKELAEKNGTPLRKPQAHILYILSKAKGPLSLADVMELAMCEPSWGRWWLGIQNDENRAASEKKWNFTSLVTMKAARWTDVELEGRTLSCAEITATGRKLLEQWDKVQKENDKPTVADELKAKAKSKKA